MLYTACAVPAGLPYAVDRAGPNARREEVSEMPARRIPRLSSLVYSLGAALVLTVALAPIATPAVHAQDGAGPGGPMVGPLGGPGMGPGMGPMIGGPGRGFRGPDGGSDGGSGYEEIAVLGQTQNCREQAGAQTNAWSYFGPTFSGYQFPPYGGVWGFYTASGPVCRWQPH
jgi:hypothetical protein